jgi:hypothetical protein
MQELYHPANPASNRTGYRQFSFLDGTSYAHLDPPPDVPEKMPRPDEPTFVSVHEQVRRAHLATLEFKQLQERLLADPRFTNEGKGELVAEARAKLNQKIEASRGRVRLPEADYAGAVNKLYAVSAPTDASERADDAELRAWYSATPVDQRQRGLAEMSAAEKDRLLLALARSLVPGVAREYGRSERQKQIAAANPDAVKRLAEQKALLDWADTQFVAMEATAAKDMREARVAVA